MRRPSALTVLLIGALTGALLALGAPSSSDRGPRTARDTTAAAPAAAAWRTVHRQTFEGTSWPASGDNWSIRDHNGPNVGTKPSEFATVVWDDNSTRAKTGAWSAHPNDGPKYGPWTDTWMRYGPFSLAGATDARLRFWHWLDTEKHYDFLAYSYSCTNNGNWTTEELSGQVKEWKLATLSLKACVGKTNVFVRIWFRSDYSNPTTNEPTGVWVDDVLVQKYSVS